MLSISQSIIVNVGADYIELYLKRKGITRSVDERSQDLKYWIDGLLQENKIDVLDFEDFLFNELFWGKRKSIQIYKLADIKNYKYIEDWEDPLNEKFNISTLNFCDILCTFPNKEETKKIAAIQSNENSKGELTKIRLLFVEYIQINDTNGYTDSLAYIPVELDFSKKIMILKAWTRQNIASDSHKSEKLMLNIVEFLKRYFNVNTQNYYLEHKKILFLMSKSIIIDAYSHISAYNEIDKAEKSVRTFINSVLEELPLKNVTYDEKGNITLTKGVMELESEIRNVLEALTISDYFYNRDFEEIWKMGLKAVVARIKFNDKECVLTSLSGESTSTPIFCTKTFMSLKNRLEESEKVEALWITMQREHKKGNLNLKFDTSNIGYLEILIKYGIRFDEEDMNSALDIYENYEKEFIRQTETNDKIAVG